MTAKEILTSITEIGIVPIVRTSYAESAVLAVEAIYNAGIRAAEITMTVPGTVLDPETARACMLAGAEFFVCPSLRLSVIEMAKRYSKVVCPGATVGGAKHIKALKGPFPQVEMIPLAASTSKPRAASSRPALARASNEPTGEHKDIEVIQD